MKSHRMELTKALVEAAKPESIAYDTQLQGFSLKSGKRAKTFVLRRDI